MVRCVISDPKPLLRSSEDAKCVRVLGLTFELQVLHSSRRQGLSDYCARRQTDKKRHAGACPCLFIGIVLTYKQETYGKLLDLCVLSGRSPESGSWIRRSQREVVPANGRDSPAPTLRGRHHLPLYCCEIFLKPGVSIRRQTG